MKSKKRFLVILLAVCLGILACLPGLACTPREVPVGSPVEESPPAASYAQAEMFPAPQDQTNTIRFERISLEDGLSQSSVFAILQDQQGFMWFGTEDGLNKYDGYQFTVYKHDPDDPMTLSNNYVRTIYEDRSGELWLGTRSGLDRFDRTTGTFTHYQHDPQDPQSLSGMEVSSTCEDYTGMLWVGTVGGGLDQLDRATNTFIHYRHDPDDPTTLSDNTVWTIYEDRSGELWIGTNGGLDRFDRTTGTFTHYQHDPSAPQSLSENEVRAIFEDRQGVLWIGTEGGGLDQLDRSSQTFIHYQHNPDDPHTLSDNRVWTILQDRAGRLWVGTQNGLDLLVLSEAEGLDRRQNRFVHYLHDPGDLHSLSCDSVRFICEDRSGVLWIGTFGGGLSKYNRTADNFTLYQHRPSLLNSLSDNMVWSIYEDRSGLLWIGTFGGGLNKLDRDSDTFTAYQHDPADPTSLSNNDVRAILEDHTGTLWVGTNYGGLNRFDSQTETFTHYLHDPHDPGSLSDNDAFVTYEDRLGNLWIGTWNGGLNRLDRATGTFVHYQHDPDDPFSLSDNCVRAIYEDRAGVLWVGTRGGINLWDGANGRFTHYQHDPDDPQSLSNGAVLSFCEDPTGAVWIATYGGGLNRFNRATQTFTHYTEKDGLPDDGVYAILADAAGFLWVSTNKGLSKFDPRTEIFRNYDVSDGLQSNEFNAGAYFQSANGEMFFGGIEGFNAFYPKQVKDNPHIPSIVITAFSKFNEVVRTDLSANEHLQLSYKDNFISFEFAALDYTAPERNQYAYMMEGLDEDWVHAGTRRYASYTNLRGGDYVFRVKGSNNDGVWNEEGVAIYITVTPPVWETWWFRGIVFVVLAGSVIGGYRLRVKSIEARSRELESQVEERTHELSTLLEVSHNVASTLELEPLLGLILDQLRAVVDYSGTAIMTLEGRVMRVLAHRGPIPQEEVLQLRFPLEEARVNLEVVRRREPVIISDVKGSTPLARAFQEFSGERMETTFGYIRCWMGVPLIVKEQVIGMLSLDHGEVNYYTARHEELALAFANQAAAAIENARLFAQVEQAAVAAERSRLARDLHDAVTQTLFSASLIAEVLPRLWERNPDEGRRRLDEVRELTRGALAEMRTLLLELRPAALVDADLGDLLRQLGEATTGRARVPVAVEVEGECSLPPNVKVALYRIAQEALNNVAKHAAASQATVSLRCPPFPPDFGGEQRGGVELCISDDGRGFDPTSIPPDHLGVGIMRERAEAIGAVLRIDSEANRGTRVVVVWSDTHRKEPL